MNKRIITSDKIITVTTTVQELERVIDYNTILDSVSIDTDDWNRPPWEDCDGYAHTIRSADISEDEKAAGFVYLGRGRGHGVIELDESAVRGEYEYYREAGLSKQVAREAVARSKARRIKQLVKWYRDGWQWWQVTCDFMNYSDSVGGVDDWDYAYDEVRHDVAYQVVRQMEKDGFIVVNLPKETDRQETKRDNARRRFQWQMNLGIH